MKVGQHNSCRVRTKSTRANTGDDRGQVRHRNGQRMDGKVGRQSPPPSRNALCCGAPSRYMYGNCNCQFKYAQTNFTVCCPDRKLKGRPAREKSWQHRLFLNLLSRRFAQELVFCTFRSSLDFLQPRKLNTNW